MSADVYSNLLDFSLHCCNKCKGLFSMPEERLRHQMTCTANPIKSPCTHFACERKIFLQLFQPEDFEVEGSFHPLNMSKDDSFINHFVKIRMPDVFDPSSFFRTTTPPATIPVEPADSNFLLEANINTLEADTSKSSCEAFLDNNEQIESIEQQQIQNIINKNIEYLKNDEIPALVSSTTVPKTPHFPSSQSESRLLSPIDKHLNFLDGSKSRGQSPFEKCAGFLNDHQFGFQSSGFNYSSNPSIPFSCNLSTDLLSSFASTNEENQQPLLTNIEERPTLQYLDLAKKDPFFGQNLGLQQNPSLQQNPGLTQMNAKDPFLTNAAVKSDRLPGIPGPTLSNQRLHIVKSCEDIQSQSSPSFQLHDANYFNFPSTLDEPTQLDYLDLATLDLLTNPNFSFNSNVMKEKVGYGKDDDIYSENNLVYHEQANVHAAETVARLDLTGNRTSADGTSRYGKRKGKSLRLKKSKSDLGKPSNTCLLPAASVSEMPLTQSISQNLVQECQTKRPNRKRKMSESRFDRYRLMPKEHFGYARKRLCKSNKIFNVSDQLTCFTEEQKDNMKAVFGRGDCIFVKKQIGENKKPVVVVEDIPASIVENLYGGSAQSSFVPNTKQLEKVRDQTVDETIVENNNCKEKKLTSVLKLKCKECVFSCLTAAELKEHCIIHKNETEIATEIITDVSEYEPKSGELNEEMFTVIRIKESTSSMVNSGYCQAEPNIQEFLEANIVNENDNDEFEVESSVKTSVNDLKNFVPVDGSLSPLPNVRTECISDLAVVSKLPAVEKISDFDTVELFSASNVIGNKCLMGKNTLECDSSEQFTDFKDSKRQNLEESSFSPDIFLSSQKIPDYQHNHIEASGDIVDILKGEMNKDLGQISSCTEEPNTNEETPEIIEITIMDYVPPDTVVSHPEMVVSAPEMIVSVPEMIVSTPEMVLSAREINTDSSVVHDHNITKLLDSEARVVDTITQDGQYYLTGQMLAHPENETFDQSVYRTVNSLDSCYSENIFSNKHSEAEFNINNLRSGSSNDAAPKVEMGFIPITGISKDTATNFGTKLHLQTVPGLRPRNRSSSLSDLLDHDYQAQQNPLHENFLMTEKKEHECSIPQMVNTDSCVDTDWTDRHGFMPSTEENNPSLDANHLVSNELDCHNFVPTPLNGNILAIKQEVIDTDSFSVAAGIQINSFTSTCSRHAKSVDTLSTGTIVPAEEYQSEHHEKLPVSNCSETVTKPLTERPRKGYVRLWKGNVDATTQTFTETEVSVTDAVCMKKELVETNGEVGKKGETRTKYTGIITTGIGDSDQKNVLEAGTSDGVMKQDNIVYTDVDIDVTQSSMLEKFGDSSVGLEESSSDTYTATKVAAFNANNLFDPAGGVYKCQDCEFTTTNRREMIAHKVKHTGGLFKCNEANCQFQSKYKRNLNEHHRQKHSGDTTKYICEHCSYSTDQKKSLTRHIQQNHLKEKRFKCSDCDYASLFRNDIVKHYQNTHVQQKLYACNQCQYKTCYAHTLKFHLMAHAGIRPYKCSACEYQVNDPSKVTRHIRTKHKGNSDVTCQKLDLEFDIDAKQFQIEAKNKDQDVKVIELSELDRENLKKKLETCDNSKNMKQKNRNNAKASTSVQIINNTDGNMNTLGKINSNDRNSTVTMSF